MLILVMSHDSLVSIVIRLLAGWLEFSYQEGQGFCFLCHHI